ncbi:M20/M25/M40 family metallo-hydrolase [Streptomyces olivoreticuli]
MDTRGLMATPSCILFGGRRRANHLVGDGCRAAIGRWSRRGGGGNSRSPVGPATVRDHGGGRRMAPWNAEVTAERLSQGPPFRSGTEGPAFALLAKAMREAFGKEMTTVGQGGSIPVRVALQETFPDAEIMLVGVEEPKCLIHAPNESVDPAEIEQLALAQALFLLGYGSDHAPRTG